MIKNYKKSLTKICGVFLCNLYINQKAADNQLLLESSLVLKLESHRRCFVITCFFRCENQKCLFCCIMFSNYTIRIT